MVRGKRAPMADLSTDESANPFFAPTFALPVGSVYQARPYVSPDTKEWVISNSTPLDTPDHSKPAILHFEVTVESFRAAAARTGQFAVDVVDAPDGARGLRQRATRSCRERPSGVPSDTRFLSLARSAGVSGQLIVGGRPAAYQRLAPLAGNTNDWVVVAVATSPGRVPVRDRFVVGRARRCRRPAPGHRGDARPRGPSRTGVRGPDRPAHRARQPADASPRPGRAAEVGDDLAPARAHAVRPQRVQVLQRRLRPWRRRRPAGPTRPCPGRCRRLPRPRLPAGR